MSDVEIQAVQAFADGVAALRAAGVTRSNRFVGDLGEWYAEVLFDGKRAANQTQKGWDVAVRATDEFLQVKTQRYDPGNRWQYLDSDPADFTHLVAVLLTDDFRVRTVYKVPRDDLVPLLRTESTTGRRRYVWDDLEPWCVDLTDLHTAAEIRSLIA